MSHTHGPTYTLVLDNRSILHFNLGIEKNFILFISFMLECKPHNFLCIIMTHIIIFTYLDVFSKVFNFKNNLFRVI